MVSPSFGTSRLSSWFLGFGYSHVLVLCLIYEVFLLLWGAIARAGAVIIYIPFLSNGCASHSREGTVVLNKARTPCRCIDTHQLSSVIAAAPVRRAITTRHKDGLVNPMPSCTEQENLNPEDSDPHPREGLGDQAIMHHASKAHQSYPSVSLLNAAFQLISLTKN